MEEMSKDDLNDKLNEYIKRSNFWSEKAINQFGYSINLFTTLGIGLLSYLITNREKFPELKFICCGNINWILVLYFSATILIFCSIVLGFLSILSRLYDFRISRHLSITRKRYFSENKSKNGFIKSEIIDISNERQFRTFKKNVFREIEFITESDFEQKHVIEKFKQLRKESKILGAFSWKMHKYQIISFIIGIFLYGLTVFKY
jgi:hypothetical protein